MYSPEKGYIKPVPMKIAYVQEFQSDGEDVIVEGEEESGEVGDEGAWESVRKGGAFKKPKGQIRVVVATHKEGLVGEKLGVLVGGIIFGKKEQVKITVVVYDKNSFARVGGGVAGLESGTIEGKVYRDIEGYRENGERILYLIETNLGMNGVTGTRFTREGVERFGSPILFFDHSSVESSEEGSRLKEASNVVGISSSGQGAHGWVSSMKKNQSDEWKRKYEKLRKQFY